MPTHATGRHPVKKVARPAIKARPPIKVTPPPIYDTLVANRSQYPTPMSSAQLGQLLNETAWAHRSEGYGMLEKTSGSHCQQPTSGIACSKDIICIIVGTDLVLYDCLIDAEGQATPTWDRKSPLQDLSRFVAPVDPADNSTPTPVPPIPPSSPVIPYNEAYAVQFGQGCNAVYVESGATVDAGMISVHAQRCAWDYYCGGLSWEDSYRKHLNEFRAEYGLPPV